MLNTVITHSTVQSTMPSLAQAVFSKQYLLHCQSATVSCSVHIATSSFPRTQDGKETWSQLADKAVNSTPSRSKLLTATGSEQAVTNCQVGTTAQCIRVCLFH